MPQTLLKARKDRWFVTRVDVDDAIGPETGLGDGGREEILPRDTPQDLAPRARSDSRCEQRGRGTVDRAIAATGDLVQRAERESAFRQMLVNRINAERQHGPMTPGPPFETKNALAKLLENGEGRRRTDVLLQLIGEMICSLFVLFGLKSQLESESVRGTTMKAASFGACVVRKTEEHG